MYLWDAQVLYTICKYLNLITYLAYNIYLFLIILCIVLDQVWISLISTYKYLAYNIHITIG